MRASTEGDSIRLEGTIQEKERSVFNLWIFEDFKAEGGDGGVGSGCDGRRSECDG